MKICTKCEIEKEEDDFYFKNKSKGNERESICKLCRKGRVKIYYEQNKNDVKIVHDTYRLAHKSELLEYNKLYYDNNKEELKKYKNEWVREKSKKDPAFRLRRISSRAINKILKNNGVSKGGLSILDYLPYTMQELKKHIEEQFEPWMTWDNYGVFLKSKYIENDSSTWTWHIDHIIPSSKFDFKTMDDQSFKGCWALSNLRPLKSIDNIKKSNKI